MGKKKGLAAIFSKPTKLAAADNGSPSPPWPWPSCTNNPETASFRRQGQHGADDRPCTTAGGRSVVAAITGRLRLPGDAAGDMYKTVNSVYFDPADDSCFSFDNEEDGDDDDALDDCVSFSTTTASEEWSEAVIRSLGRSSTGDRFFFDSGPPPASNSILAASRSPSPSPGRTLVTQSPHQPKAPAAAIMPDTEGDSDEDVEEDRQHQDAPALASTSPLVEESVAVALDSEDPYRDFHASMEEMVAAHGLRDWPSLQEMLLWYLRINDKHNHALILGAFVDLLVGLAASGSRSSTALTSATTTTTMTTTTTAATTSSSSSTSSSIAGDGATCSTPATMTTVDEQCGGGSSGTDDASCSPASPSSDHEDDEEEARDELAFHVKLRT